MKSKQADKVSVLRMVVTGLKNAEIDKGSELDDNGVEQVLKKEAKKRQEAIELYKKAERKELVEKEEKELEIIKAYLPEEMSEEKLVELVGKLKSEGKLTDFGTAMKLVMCEVKGQADGKLVAKVVKENL